MQRSVRRDSAALCHDNGARAARHALNQTVGCGAHPNNRQSSLYEACNARPTNASGRNQTNTGTRR
eukprot:10639089-Lingulodinium_polyedra.AAC.1